MTDDTLKIACDELFAIPKNAVTEKLCWLGTTGSGKSYGAMKLAEEMSRIDAQFVALDPVGIWHGLRTAKDGKAPGIAIPIFGGLHGDIPVGPHVGKLMADLVVDNNLTCIIDVSEFEHDTDKAKFAADFAERLYHRKKRKRSAIHVFLEEAEEFIPQEPEAGENRMLHAFKRIWKLGRNFGIGGSLISQRPQELSKKCLNLSSAVFAFRCVGPHERAAIKGWMKDKDIEQDIAGDLPKLKTGTCHLWSPTWLGISEQVKIGPRWTFDSSATPEVGGKVKSVKMAEIDLLEIGRQMQTVTTEFKANDPVELKKRLAEVEKELGDLKRKGDKLIVHDPSETLAQIADLQKKLGLAKGWETELNQIIGGLNRTLTRQKDAFTAFVATFVPGFAIVGSTPQIKRPSFLDEVPKVTGFTGDYHGGKTRAMPTPATAQADAQSDASERQAEQQRAQAAGDLKITGGQQRILDALRWFRAIGVDHVTPLKLGAVALMDTTGGHFSNLIGPLVTCGLVERSKVGFYLTTAGLALANLPEKLTTMDAYHEMLCARVLKTKQGTPGTVKILKTVIAQTQAAKRQTTTAAIGQALGIDHTGGHFSNLIGPLSTLGLIDRDKGTITATDILFPDGIN